MLHGKDWKDYTGSFRPLGDIAHLDDAAPMYSYERPAYLFWSAFMNGLRASGLTEKQAKEWLQSKKTRWALDGNLGDAIEDLAYDYAKKHAKE